MTGVRSVKMELSDGNLFIDYLHICTGPRNMTVNYMAMEMLVAIATYTNHQFERIFVYCNDKDLAVSVGCTSLESYLSRHLCSLRYINKNVITQFV